MLQFRPPSRASLAGLSTEPGVLLRWGMTSRTSRILFIIMITEPGFSTTRSKMGSRSYRNIRQQASTLFFFRNALRFSRHNKDLEHFDLATGICTAIGQGYVEAANGTQTGGACSQIWLILYQTCAVCFSGICSVPA